MSDNGVSREEMQAELRALRAESREQFAQILGEVKTANATVTGAIGTLKSDINGDIALLRSDLDGKLEALNKGAAGQKTVWGAAGAVIAAIVATIIVLFQVAQSAYDTGRSSNHDRGLQAEGASLEK